MRLLGILILISTMFACVPVSPQSQGTPAQHRQWAMELIEIHDLPGATAELRQALAGNPNLADYLLYADLLEAQKKYKDARQAYEKAGRYPADAAQQADLNHRLGLLETDPLDHPATGEKLLKLLPKTDSRHHDLQAVLLLKQGHPDQALAASKQALSLAKTNEEKGWAYYHMAQIYYALRVEKETFGSLFHAVNYGRGHSLVAQITEYWESRRYLPFPKN